jgi:arabinogalactan endo-1,4-beta-galactosidase
MQIAAGIKKILFLMMPVALCMFGSSCKKGGSGDDSGKADSTNTTTISFIKGADPSWLTQMEASGIKFYNAIGTQQDCIQTLKDKGINTIRLRAWVNPSDGWCNTSDMVVKAVRAKKLGMKIIVDLHYSDVWADPGHQTKPAAWANLSFSSLVTVVQNYTVSVMDSLKVHNITPDYVQVGNETNDGMLWPDGQASKNMANFAALVTAGYNGVKSVSSTTKVIVHVSNGYDNAAFHYVFDGLKANKASWDVIGMSLYPSTDNWQNINIQCLANMKDMVSRYNTPVMICEVGMDVTAPATTQLFIADLISKVKSVPNNKGLGVLYWEPEAYNGWASYTLGAFSYLGRPTVALDAFAN